MSVEFYGKDHHHRDPQSPAYPARIYLDDNDPRNFALNEGNACALWPLLGLPLEDGQVPPRGEVGVAEARHALAKARATLVRDAPLHVRPTTYEHGAPRVQEDGTIALRPLRAVWLGLDEDDVADRFERFAQFVEAIAERGATHIAWA
jgi:hypothetical protein